MKYLQIIQAKSIMDRLSAMGVEVSGNPAEYGFYVDQQIDSRFATVRRVFIADNNSDTTTSSDCIILKSLKFNAKEIFPEGFPVKMLFPSRLNFLSEVNAQGDTLNGARIEGDFSNPNGRLKLFIILELVN
jgi:hypothetical protein